MLKEKVFRLVNLYLEQYVESVEITEDSHFADDLGMDSLDLVELIMEIENNFKVSIPEELERADRVSDLLNFLEGAEGLTIPEEVRLTLYGKGAETQKTETFVAPKVKKLAFLSDDEVGEMNKTLHGDIEDYVNEEIANWTEMCECEEEGDGLDFALNSEYPSWRVRNDGTIDVVIHGNSKKSFDFGWEDEDGRSRTSNALNLLRGNVSYRFFNTDKCNNDLPDELAERVVELFK
jgi:acyl carrier protein